MEIVLIDMQPHGPLDRCDPDHCDCKKNFRGAIIPVDVSGSLWMGVHQRSLISRSRHLQVPAGTCQICQVPAGTARSEPDLARWESEGVLHHRVNEYSGMLIISNFISTSGPFQVP